MLAGAAPDPRIVPFRGAYLKLVAGRSALVRGLIYPVPDPRLPFLGVHLTRHVGGDVLIGPTALLAPASARRLSRRCAGRAPGGWRGAGGAPGVTELHHALSLPRSRARRRATCPSWSPATPSPPGRACALRRSPVTVALVDDFVFSHTERALHVRNAPSPAATAALAIARHVADETERAL